MALGLRATSADSLYLLRRRKDIASPAKPLFHGRSALNPGEQGGPRRKLARYAKAEDRIEKMKDLGFRDNGVTMAEYTSLLFVGERAVITYDVYGTGSLGHALNLRVLPLKWFYKKTPSDSLLEK